MNTRTRNVVYWLTTGLLALAMGASSLAYLGGLMTEALAHLGYSAPFPQILGVWKGLGALALVAPGLPRLKEWAYAGFFFTFTGAAVSHVAAGDGPGEIVAPLVMLALAMTSWALRPSDRVLGHIPGVLSAPARTAAAGG